MKLFLAVCLIATANACIWDRDTLAHDSEGQLDTAKTLVGWFDRYPPQYYEMRLARVTKELADHPDSLELYDDAAVSLDRLHRSIEAIEMMERKDEALKRLVSTANSKTIWEHRYRYLANLGTFYAHRWIRLKPESRNSDLSDLKKAEELIAAAIEHNPNAHFGREQFQLDIIRWFQEDEFTGIAKFDQPIFDNSTSSHTKNKDVEDSDDTKVTGLLGMVQLGGAWQSVDIYRNIHFLLNHEGRNALAYVAHLRVTELRGSGKNSLHPLKVDAAENKQFSAKRFLESGQVREIKSWFKNARKASDQRYEQRTNYMLDKFKTGEHPDTHPDFWNEWDEPNFIGMPGTVNYLLSSPSALVSYILKPFVFMKIIIALLITAIITLKIKARRKRALGISMP